MKGLMSFWLVVATACLMITTVRAQTVVNRHPQGEALLNGWEFHSNVGSERAIANQALLIGEAPALVVNCDRFIEVVNLRNGDAKRLHPRRLRNFTSICEFEDNCFLAADSRGEVSKVDVDRVVRQEVEELQLRLPHRICAHVETHFVAAAHQGNSVLLWDWRVPSQAVPVEIHRLGALDIAISFDGETCAAVTYDGRVRLIDLRQGEISTVLTPTSSGLVDDERQSFRAVAWQHESRQLAALRGDTLHIWDSQDWSGERAVALPAMRGVDLACSSEGPSFIVAGTSSGRKALAVIDAQSGDVLHVAIGAEGQYTSLVHSSDGQWMAICSLFDGVSVWHAHTTSHLD